MASGTFGRMRGIEGREAIAAFWLDSLSGSDLPPREMNSNSLGAVTTLRALARSASFQTALQFVELDSSRVRSLANKYKKGPIGAFFVFGGEREIRTLERLPVTHFPGVRLRPLGHLTLRARIIP